MFQRLMSGDVLASDLSDNVLGTMAGRVYRITAANLEGLDGNKPAPSAARDTHVSSKSRPYLSGISCRF